MPSQKKRVEETPASQGGRNMSVKTLPASKFGIRPLVKIVKLHPLGRQSRGRTSCAASPPVTVRDSAVKVSTPQKRKRKKSFKKLDKLKNFSSNAANSPA